MNKILPILIGLVLLAGVGGFVFMKQGSSSYAPDTNAPQGDVLNSVASENATTSSQSATVYTAADVATHKDASSCWTIIDSSVYDLTQWVAKHPGGSEAILSICGIDGSNAFHQQHDHKQKQETILATFKIGTLAQ